MGDTCSDYWVKDKSHHSGKAADIKSEENLLDCYTYTDLAASTRRVPPPWPILSVVSQRESMHLVIYRFVRAMDINLPRMTNMSDTELVETMYTVEVMVSRASFKQT